MPELYYKISSQLQKPPTQVGMLPFSKGRRSGGWAPAFLRAWNILPEQKNVHPAKFSRVVLKNIWKSGQGAGLAAKELLVSN
jgi:hypothetical protein